jgi:rare lipoprotein A
MPSLTVRWMRAQNLTPITIGVAALVLAFALGGADAFAQTAQNTMSLRVAPARVIFGQTVNVMAAAPASDAGQQAVLEALPAGGSTWRQAASTTVGPAGRFGFRLIPLASSALRVILVPSGSQTPTDSSDAVIASGPSNASAAAAVVVKARFWLRQRRLALLGGGTFRVAGKLLPAVGGRVVHLQARTRSGWRVIDTEFTGPRGGFSVDAAASHAGQQLRVSFAGDGRNAHSTRSVGRALMFSAALVSWYVDSGQTGCGFHAWYGIANRTLPCGTRVNLRNGGRSVTAVVDDRGPYVGGREFDLNQNTAAALGFSGVGQVWFSL